MPAAAGCSNCCTKYSLFTKEYGCPLCHLSFCKKCLTRRLRKPNNGEEIAVCTSCFQKATNPQPVAPPRHNRPGNSVTGGNGQGQPWWGEGLPPPSMRTQTNPAPWRQVNMVPQGYKSPVNAAGPSGSSAQGSPCGKNPNPHPETHDLEEKLSELRKDLPENKQRALTVSEIEERLAALRGCDVELVRNPRTWFASSSDCQPMESDTVEGLLKMASDRAKIEDNVDRDLEERYRRVRMRDEEATSEPKEEQPETDENGGAGTEDYRMSAASQDTAFSEATKAELAEIKEMMAAADERIRNARPTDEDVDREMKHTLADVRQKSIDIDKINREIGNYYMNRSRTDETELDSDEDEDTKSLTDEVLQRIIKEAEETEHDEPVAKKRDAVHCAEAPSSEGTPKSPKSPGFFGRIFRK